jgi:hypothetical protein
LQQAGLLLGRGLEQPGRVGQGALHQADELGEQFLTAGKLGQLEGRLGVEHLAVEVSPADDQLRVILLERLQRLGGTHRVLGAEDQPGRALQELVEPLDAGSRGRPAGQGVLDDLHLRAGLAQASAQLRELGHRETPVVGEQRRRRAREVIADLFDLGDLLWPCHV